MKVAILAGGLGTRLAEETDVKPKPMVEIGGRPILWHIMKHYAQFGFNEFAVALGYKGEVVKRFFLDYWRLTNDLTVQLSTGETEIHDGRREDWMVHLVETGLPTQTGGRVKRLAPWLGNETFMMTYGDGVSDVDIASLLQFHRSHGRIATLTAVRPPARFGRLDFIGDFVSKFAEKPQAGDGWINGGFFVFEPEVFDYIASDDTALEHEPLKRLADEGQLMAYHHDSFWQCMDTLRDKHLLEELWQSGNAPWKVWEEQYAGSRNGA
ncbi:MAG: glucose-1-phosphate cytidylyltransferase [Dehalococcoidia bacterium]